MNFGIMQIGCELTSKLKQCLLEIKIFFGDQRISLYVCLKAIKETRKENNSCIVAVKTCLLQTNASQNSIVNLCFLTIINS